MKQLVKMYTPSDTGLYYPIIMLLFENASM